MADIFDKKEEVLDVVLTKKGRELMSINKFKPAFYEFYDSEIIYDASNNENQNSSSERIKDGLYQKSTVSLFSKNTTPGQLLIEENDTELPSMNLKNPIGSYEIGTQNAPAWSIQFYEGEYLPASDVFSSGESPEFEVEIYEVVDTEGNVEKNKSLKRLYFDKEDFEDLDSVENYLNVLFDEEARFESNFKEISIYNALQEEDGEECQ